MIYKIVLEKAALKSLNKLLGKMYYAVSDTLEKLKEEPRPNASILLKGYKSVYSTRLGSYRIIYEIIDDRLLILILVIGSRGQVYDNY
jgi:mRNA interferase RelE/StbE